MTQLRTACIGSYPRIGEEKDHQRHRRGLGHFERGEISAHAFRDVVQSVVHETVRELADMGLDELTDGLISWIDPISHLCSQLPGIRLQGLDRYFDNNFYYRVPVIEAKPRFKQSLLAAEYEFAASVSPLPFRVVATGPHTLAAHTRSDIKPFLTPAARADLFTDVLVQEIQALAAKKAPTIQIDEPSLLIGPQDWKAVKKRLSALKAAGPHLRLVLTFPFHSALASLDRLLDLPVDALNLDMVTGGDPLWQRITQGTSLPVELGVLDARSTKADDLASLKEKISTYLSARSPDTLALTPNTGLEYLPRPHAREKIRALVKLKMELVGHS